MRRLISRYTQRSGSTYTHGIENTVGLCRDYSVTSSGLLGDLFVCHASRDAPVDEPVGQHLHTWDRNTIGPYWTTSAIEICSTAQYRLEVTLSELHNKITMGATSREGATPLARSLASSSSSMARRRASSSSLYSACSAASW
jgi:hypothetical protein